MTTIPPAEIPLIASLDVLVMGSGLAGLPVARLAAEKGLKTWLVTPSTSLGEELWAWQRPWIRWDPGNSALTRLWLQAGLPQMAAAPGTLLPLHPDRIKRSLEDTLLESGVQLIYASLPVSCARREQGWQVVIGNKSGRQAILARQVVDASLHSTLARLLNPQDCLFTRAQGEANSAQPPVVHRTLEFTQVGPDAERVYPLPEELGVVGNQVELYPGAFSKDHFFLDFSIKAPGTPGRSLEIDAQIEYTARKTSLESASYLVHQIPAFRKARLGFGSPQVCPEPGFDALERLAYGQETAENILKEGSGERCVILAAQAHAAEERQAAWIFGAHGDSIGQEDLVYREESTFNELYRFPLTGVGAIEVPVEADSGVLVVGGGTSGAVAAWSAACEGVSTTLIEANPALGGTATLGGVSMYWFGNRNAFTRDIDQRVMEWGRRLSYPQEFYVWGKKDAWSPELKAFALLEMCVEAGVKVSFQALTTGALLDGDRVAGVVAATPYGPRAFLGEALVDATGDGDVAAFAGGETLYGNERDRMTLWAALNYFSAPGKYKAGNFTTTVDVGDIFDCTRFILVNRRRGDEDLYDHSSMISPRETRHVRGEVVLTLADQILMRRFPDAISLCFSNHDPKGRSTSDIVYSGILPPHLEIEIPYRAVIPEHLDGLLVTGKAVSCTHDALAAIRMIDDLQQQGGAVGLAAALCVKNGCRPRDLDTRPLQKRLVRKGLLPRNVLDPLRERAAHPDLAALIAGLSGDEHFEWLEMGVREKAASPSPLVWLCTAQSEEIAPLLHAAHEMAEGKLRLLLARLLLWHGQEAGFEDVLQEIYRMLPDDPPLPSRRGSIRFCTIPPDHGVTAEVIPLVNLLGLLEVRSEAGEQRNPNSVTRARQAKTVRLLEELVERIWRAERDYRDFRKSIYNYLDSLAYVAERLALPGCIPALERALALPELQDRVCTQNLEIDIIGERQATLVICLGRALARCGSRDGLLRLAPFTADNRALLARSARDELVALTGLDCGNNAPSWIEALQGWPERFEPRPWRGRMD